MTEPIARSGPNTEQIDYWNDEAGAKWVELQERLDDQIDALGGLAMDRAAVAPGERVLDVGCGCGSTCLQLAERVGARGAVLGIDVSTAMLARADERARAAGVSNVAFANADAQTHAFEPASFDLVFSRFGVMFFADPAAAFANLRRALKPGGRTTFVCWRPITENPWMFEPVRALAEVMTLPEPPPPDAPGPFSFADPERVRGILVDAGFAPPEIEACDRELALGGGDPSLDDAVSFVLRIGPAARALADADDALRARAAEAVRAALAPYEGARGVRLQGAVWIVRATNLAP